MTRRDFEENRSIIMSGVAVPKEFIERPLRDALIIGFDTEWNADTTKLLSVQFAVNVEGGFYSRVYDPPAAGLTAASLTTLVVRFLGEAGVTAPITKTIHRVTLVAHFAQAELSMVEDAIEAFHINVLGKAHHASGPNVDVDGETWHLKIVDLFAFFPVSLANVGKAVGLEKLDEDREKLAELKAMHPERFNAYASRDAEITVLALTQFREDIHTKYGLDVLSRHSLAGIASEIFRTRYMNLGAARSERRDEPYNRKIDGEWVKRTKNVTVYAGDPFVRERAALAAWGARVEAFRFGLVVGPCRELDVVSQYPHAAINQPLPNCRTEWLPVSDVAQVQHLEGFAEIKFRFPSSQAFPSLPVMSETEKRLVFPRSGRTDCTFSEIRAAVALGAEITLITGVGFKPGERERNHDVAAYMRDLIEQKATATKGSLEYVVTKMLLNALVGKFWERTGGTNIVEFEREARLHGHAGLAAFVAKSSQFRGVLKRKQRTGSLYAIEWAALILGRARSMMASIVAAGSHLVSTDAVIVPAGTDVESDGLRELRSVGSDLKEEHTGDAVFIARPRTYAFLKRVANLTPEDKPLAVDGVWAVVKAARHGSVETEAQFAETILACLRAKRDVTPERVKVRLATAEGAVRLGVPINDEVPVAGKTHLSWKGSRRLLDRDVNQFVTSSGTAPFDSVKRLEGAARQKLVKDGKVRRRRDKSSRRRLTEVMTLLREGFGPREIERRTGVPRSTVSDLASRSTRQPHEPQTEAPTVKEGQ